MAWIYRPIVTRKTKDGGKIKSRSRRWWAKFEDPATGEKIRIPLKTRDKTTARQLAAEAERKAALAAAGLGNTYERQWARPLEQHVADFKQALLDKGNTLKHACLTAQRVEDLLEGIKTERWQQITPGAVQSWLAERRASEDAISSESSNHYLRAIKNFCRWMVKNGLAPHSPVAVLSLINSKPDQRVRRRALTVEELKLLLQVTAAEPARYCMSGPERALLYRVAVETGLRANELATLTPSSFSLTSDPPTVTVKAGYSKHRREDVLPLRPTTAALLAEHLQGKADRSTGL